MTADDFKRKILKAFLKDLKAEEEEEVRRRYREEMNVIYVREYTVSAHVYQRKPKPLRRRVSPKRAPSTNADTTTITT